jgi:hypothetical protein
MSEISLRRYFRAIYFVTRGPLLSGERLKMALRLALGRLDYLRDEYVASHPPAK